MNAAAEAVPLGRLHDLRQAPERCPGEHDVGRVVSDPTDRVEHREVVLVRPEARGVEHVAVGQADARADLLVARARLRPEAIVVNCDMHPAHAVGIHFEVLDRPLPRMLAVGDEHGRLLCRQPVEIAAPGSLPAGEVLRQVVVLHVVDDDDRRTGRRRDHEVHGVVRHVRRG